MPAPGASGTGGEITQLADRLAAPVVKSMLGKDVLPDDSPYTTGGIGVIGTRPSSEVMERCGAVVIVGSCFPYIAFLPKPGQALGIQIDDKPEHIGCVLPWSTVQSETRKLACASGSYICLGTKTVPFCDTPSRACRTGGT